MIKVLFMLLLACASTTAFARKHDILEKSVWYRALECYETSNLPKVLDREDFERKVNEGELVSLAGIAAIHRDLPPWRACVIPVTRDYVVGLEHRFKRRFGRKFPIDSAARTVDVQKALILRNPNAAPAHGPLASTHLTGAAIDIGYKDLTRAERAWLETELSRDKRAGFIQAVRELTQACYHVTVFPSKWKPHRHARKKQSRHR